MIVPSDLRKFVGKTELRYSLNTGYLGEAKSKARLMAGMVQNYFRSIRKMVKLKGLSDTDIQWLVNTAQKDGIEMFEKMRVKGTDLCKIYLQLR